VITEENLTPGRQQVMEGMRTTTRACELLVSWTDRLSKLKRQAKTGSAGNLSKVEQRIREYPDFDLWRLRREAPRWAE